MTTGMLRVIAYWVFLSSALCVSAEPPTNPAPALLVGEEPYASADLLTGKYQSVLGYLRKQKMNANYLPARDYAHFVQQAREQKIDIAFVSSGLASLLVDKFSYQMVLASDNTLNAVVFVNSRSKVYTLQQLSRATILAPEPYDIVYEMAHRLILSRGMDQIMMPHIVQTPKVDKIILSVMKGEYTAGIVAGYDLALVKPDLRKMVHIVEQSDNVTAHYILLRKSLPEAHKQSIEKTMLDFHKSAEGDSYARDFGSSVFTSTGDQHEQELLAFREFGEFIGNAKPSQK